MPIVDPPSRPRSAIVFSFRALASSNARATFLDLPGGCQANEHISRQTKRCYLASENFIEAVIVCGRSEKSAIARKANRGMSGAVLREAHDELGHKMCRISRAPAVPANKQFVSRAQTLPDQIGSFCDSRFKFLERLKRPDRIVNRPVKD